MVSESDGGGEVLGGTVAELERLEALWRYDVLDTPPEEVFDDLTALAAQICGTPISLLSLIDADRQWFKSRVGVEHDGGPREHAFCARAIEQDRMLVVTDATQDPRFADNPDVAGGMGIRFYAGAPLITPEGAAVGTLCVIDRVPRELTPDQVRALRALSRAVVAQLELRRQNERLRNLDRLKDDFVALVSHELRTPITSIRGYLELLLAGDGGPLTESQRRFLGVIDRNTERLVRLVGDLLFIARAEAGGLELEMGEADMAAVLGESADAARPAAEARTIEMAVSIEDVPAVLGDRQRLGQLVDNLVSNAVKFTPEGGRIELALRRAGEAVLVEVRDNGDGIPAAEMPLLFSRFYRARAATAQNVPGTGLGLAIAKAIAEGHGGSITVESSVGAGTRVRVELPLRA